MNNYLKEWRKNNPDKVKKSNRKWNIIWNPITNPKRIKFKGKQITVKKNPRKGICSKCKKSIQKGEIQVTHLHHLKYNSSDILKYTIELCASCHINQHKIWEKKK